ncbi:hypothetical protein [Ekhidna sp.]
MEEQKSMNFSEWVDTLTVTDVVNIFLMIGFTAVILWLVVRTFRGKSSA